MNDSYLEPPAEYPHRSFVDPDDDPYPVGLMPTQFAQWQARNNPDKDRKDGYGLSTK